MAADSVYQKGAVVGLLLALLRVEVLALKQLLLLLADVAVVNSLGRAVRICPIFPLIALQSFNQLLLRVLQIVVR